MWLDAPRRECVSFSERTTMNKLSATNSPALDAPTDQQNPTVVTQVAEGLQRYKFSLEQYHRLGETDIIDPDIRMELIRGELMLMASKGIPHEVCLTRLNRVLVQKVGSQAVVRVQSPVIIPPDSEPEPDFTIARLRDDDYMNEHPMAADVHLLIEVSASSLYVDRTIKLALYAEAGVPHYWIFDVNARQLQTYSDPQLLRPSQPDEAYAYTQHLTLTDSQQIAIPDLKHVELELIECFQPKMP